MSAESQHSEASPQHTPGPWRLVSNVFTYDVFGPEGDLIADVFSPADPDVTAHMNATLIAAAPKMLAALKKTVKWFPPDDAQMALTRAAVLAAIAEAESGQS